MRDYIIRARSAGGILIAEGEAVVDCHFCKERYVFDVAELEGLRAEG